MTYLENLWLFLTLLIGIVIVPGMDMLFVPANAITGGRRMGLAATSGVMAGGAVHTLFGAVGVGVLSSLAPSLLTAMLFVGAAYMAWIGLTMLRHSLTIGAIGAATTRTQWVAFRQGAVTCLLNPKAYVFVMAVYPQFIRPQYGAVWSQALVMGILTALTQLAVYGGLALAAGQSRDFLVSSRWATVFAGRTAGLLFIAVAALTAWHGFMSG
jgi:threonine/homoserine/homoserine lactone efflux protein